MDFDNSACLDTRFQFQIQSNQNVKETKWREIRNKTKQKIKKNKEKCNTKHISIDW